MRYRSGAAEDSQRVVISVTQGGRSLCQHRGAVDCPEPWNGQDDGDVTVFFLFCIARFIPHTDLGGAECFEQRFDRLVALLKLLKGDPNARKERSRVTA